MEWIRDHAEDEETAADEKGEEEKYIGYTERVISLIRDMEYIRGQSEVKETSVVANDEGEKKTH